MSTNRSGLEIETKIAASFGNNKDGKPLSLEKIESLVRKVKDMDEAKTKRFLVAQQQLLDRKETNAKRGKVDHEFVCPNSQCKNTLDELFEKDDRMAQVTCKVCGTVVKENQVFDGEWARQFEGEVNPSSHGKPPDPRFGSAHNLATGMAKAPNASNKQAKDLALAQEKVEMNLSKSLEPSEEKRTRQGYKDKEKNRMFDLMVEVSDSMQLHRNVLARAQTLFATLRDETEQLNMRFEHGAACLILAYREKREESVSKSASAAGGAAPPGPLVFLCKYCGFDFSLKRDLTMHVPTCDKNPKFKQGT